jgi:Tfp pilus assembly protein PilO
VAVLSAGYFFILKPKHQAIIRGAEETIRLKQTEYDGLNTYFVKLQRYIANYATIGDDKKKLVDEMLPAGLEPEKLFTSLEALIIGRGLELNSIELIPDEKRTKKDLLSPEAEAGIGHVRVTLSITGIDYKGLKDLLNTIENNLNLLDVEKVSWLPSTRSVSIEAKTYYLK